MEAEIRQKVFSKLLSHRNRSFYHRENSLVGIRKASNSQLPFLEIDTRVSSDGKIFVYHDPTITDNNGREYVISNTKSEVLRDLTLPKYEKLNTLEDCLSVFADRSNKNQSILIDIKDFGFERQHIDVTKSLGVSNNAYFVSWIPQTLMKIREIDKSYPLILSHINLKSKNFIWGILNHLLRDKTFSVGKYAVIGEERYSDNLQNMRHGYQHAYFAKKVPDVLVSTLSESNGGICISESFLGPEVKSFCSTNGLLLSIFSINNIGDIRRYSIDPNIDIIFSDISRKVIDTFG